MNGKILRHFFPIVTLTAGLLLSSSSLAQQGGPDAGFVAPTQPKPKVENIPGAPVQPARFDITGIIAQAFKLKKPLQLINPLAPAKYGDGHDNVSWDPDKPEKPKGIILLGIQW